MRYYGIRISRNSNRETFETERQAKDYFDKKYYEVVRADKQDKIKKAEKLLDRYEKKLEKLQKNFAETEKVQKYLELMRKKKMELEKLITEVNSEIYYKQLKTELADLSEEEDEKHIFMLQYYIRKSQNGFVVKRDIYYVE